MSQKRFAFLIGANGPQTKGLATLKYAEKDAQRLAEALLAPHCAFTQVEWSIAESRQPTLGRLLHIVKQCESSDLLLIHFSGQANYVGQLFLLCNDTDIDNCFSSAISIDVIKFYLDKCKARYKVLVLDCSNAGAAYHSKDTQSNLQQALGRSVNAILLACSHRERTRELEILDGGAGFLSWTLITACTSRFEEVSPDRHSLSLMDIWKWIPTALQEVNGQLEPKEQLPRPILLNEMIADRDGEIWLTEQRRAYPQKRRSTMNQLDSTQQLPIASRPLRVFLCHSSQDKPSVRQLYYRLKAENITPWFDEEDLIPGQNWDTEIRKAVHSSDIIIACLSKHSINKVGYVQKEIKIALDVADEQPEGTIFLIPLRLEECEIPDRLKHLHWVNYFEKSGFLKLMHALKLRARLP